MSENDVCSDGTEQSTCLKCEESTIPPTGKCPTCGSKQMVRGNGGVRNVQTGSEQNGP